ncbi:MAG: hypothetical protein JO089_04605 [Alphaproteobacteria bacterium]|nr:hypothetical protein [Alphaproteobacteria bacterium]
MTESSEARKLKKALAAQQKEIDEGTIMHIQSQSENWSECTLEDGTKIRIRPVITEVRKLRKLGVDGKPSYGVKSALITDTQHPVKAKKGT